MKILHTTVRPGETLNDAIIRAGVDANRSGMDGYQIDCERCGDSVEDHMNGRITAEDCRTGINFRHPIEGLKALARDLFRKRH